jgi:hypothetical protein
MLNSRHGRENFLGRARAVSNDGGVTFGPISYDPILIGPVCEGSITTFNNVTYFSNPATNITQSQSNLGSLTGRFNISVRRSANNAETWEGKYLIDRGQGFGYTNLVNGPIQQYPGKGGILWEAWNGSIKFAHFPLDF